MTEADKIRAELAEADAAFFAAIRHLHLALARAERDVTGQLLEAKP